MNREEQQEFQDSGEDILEGVDFERAPQRSPTTETDDAQPDPEGWLNRRPWLIHNPRWTTGFLGLAVAGGIFAVSGNIPSSLLALALTVLVYTMTRASQQYFRRLQEWELTAALKNFAKGSYVGLPVESELSRAFEETAEAIERQLENALKDREEEAATVRREANLESARVEQEKQKVADTLRDLHGRFEAEKEAWAKERSQLEEKAQHLLETVKTERKGVEKHRAYWDSQREEIEATNDRLRAEIAESDITRKKSEQLMREEQEKFEEQAHQLQGRGSELEQRTEALEATLDERSEECRKLRESLERLEEECDQVGTEQLRFFDQLSGKLRGPLRIAAKTAEEISRAHRSPNQDGEEPMDSPESKALEIETHLKRLDLLIEQVIDMCKSQSSRWKAVFTRVDVRRLVARHFVEIQDVTCADRIDLDLATADDLPAVDTDERLLGRSVRELLTNAVRYTDPGGKVRVVAEVLDGNSDSESLLRIAVTDNGAGVAAADHERIFEPFARADDRPRFKESDAGAGLGLTLARRYIDLLGGGIELQSAPGAGSTFTIVVPARVSESASVS